MEHRAVAPNLAGLPAIAGEEVDIGTETSITMSDPAGLALVGAVALLYLALRLLPRLLVGAANRLSPADLKRSLGTDTRLLVLDVRSPREFREDFGHIPGSINLPFERLESVIATPETKADWSNRLLIVVCRSDTRAVFALRKLRRAGYRRVRVLAGGITNWVDYGFEVER